MRLPNAQKWDKDRIAAVKIILWSIHEAREPTVVFREPVSRKEPEQTGA